MSHRQGSLTRRNILILTWGLVVDFERPQEWFIPKDLDGVLTHRGINIGVPSLLSDENPASAQADFAPNANQMLPHGLSVILLQKR